MNCIVVTAIQSVCVCVCVCVCVSQREEISVVLEMLRGKGHHLGDRTTVAWLRVYGM